MNDKLITCPHCIYEVKGKCELSGEYVSDNQYCGEADDYDCEIHSGAFGAEDFCSYDERKGGEAE